MSPGSTYLPLASMTCCAPISSKAPWLASATTFSSCTATSNGRTVYSFATRPFLTSKSYITACAPLKDGRGLGGREPFQTRWDTQRGPCPWPPRGAHDHPARGIVHLFGTLPHPSPVYMPPH